MEVEYAPDADVGEEGSVLWSASVPSASERDIASDDRSREKGLFFSSLRAPPTRMDIDMSDLESKSSILVL